MKKQLLTMLVVLTLCFNLIGCGKDTQVIEEQTVSDITKPIETVVEDTEEVMLDESATESQEIAGDIMEDDSKKDYTNKTNLDNSLYLADLLYENTQDNIVFSPTSLNMALGMAAEGATDGTKEKLDLYLGETDYRTISKSLRDRYYSELEENLEEFDTGFALNIENSAWVAQGYKIVPSFQDSIIDNYNATIDVFDNLNPVGSASLINQWGEEKTKGLIKQIISPEDITDETSLILVNTIYFKDSWGSEVWSDYESENSEFINLNGTKVPNVLITNTVDGYYENDYAEAFKARYCTGLSFIGILPKEEGEFNVSDLDIDGLLQNNKTSDYTDIVAIMPEFKYSTSVNCLKQGLSDIGLGELFNSDAHFENIVETKGITCIDNILQKCTIDLDKYGTEASAETAVLFVTKGLAMVEEEVEPVIKEVKIDRPFAFMIMDEETKQIIFIGKIVNL